MYGGLLTEDAVDQTGLKGKYDFNLNYTYDEDHAPTDGDAGATGTEAGASEGPIPVLMMD
jgi:uncharacterized protein (TIGR03435 family)